MYVCVCCAALSSHHEPVLAEAGVTESVPFHEVLMDSTLSGDDNRPFEGKRPLCITRARTHTHSHTHVRVRTTLADLPCDASRAAASCAHASVS